MNDGIFMASYLILWAVVIALALTTLALLRQIGVLHARLRPMGVHFGGEGPERLQPAPASEVLNYRGAKLTLVAFTSADCTICESLRPGLRALEKQYPEVKVHLFDHDETTVDIFGEFKVRSTPYMVTVDSQGIVQARGIANSLEQVEVMIEESLGSGGPL